MLYLLKSKKKLELVLLVYLHVLTLSVQIKVFAPQRMRNYVGSEKRNRVYPDSGQCEYDETILS